MIIVYLISITGVVLVVMVAWVGKISHVGAGDGGWGREDGRGAGQQHYPTQQSHGYTKKHN